MFRSYTGAQQLTQEPKIPEALDKISESIRVAGRCNVSLESLLDGWKLKQITTVK
jgi:hypothetical protein